MEIKIVNVSAVLMPNGEVICMGKSIGFVGEKDGQIPPRYITEVKLVRPV